jgi:hypothetical protein
MNWWTFEIVDDREPHPSIVMIGGRLLYLTTEFRNEQKMSFLMSSE